MKTIKELRIKARRLPIAAEDRAAYETRIKTPEGAAIAVRTLLDDCDVEKFVVIPLDAQNKPLGLAVAGQGSVDSCPVDPREVFRPALLVGASGVIVAHNHPSGDTRPSSEDLALTERLVKCGRLLGLPVLDHLIVTTHDHCSLREDHGYLWEEARNKAA